MGVAAPIDFANGKRLLHSFPRNRKSGDPRLIEYTTIVFINQVVICVQRNSQLKRPGLADTTEDDITYACERVFPSRVLFSDTVSPLC